MITPQQNQEVIQFLLSKRLPIDLISEIHDHIMSQIHEYQCNEMDFQEAFQKVKNDWDKDFKMGFNFWLLSYEARLTNKVYWSRTGSNEIKHLLLSLPISLMILVGLFYYSSPALWYAVTAFYTCIAIGFFYYQFFVCRKYYQYRQKYEHNTLSIYSYIVKYAYILYFSLPYSVLTLHNYSVPNNWVETTFLVLLSLVFIISNGYLIPIYQAQVKFNRAIDTKVEPYLPYLDSQTVYNEGKSM